MKKDKWGRMLMLLFAVVLFHLILYGINIELFSSKYWCCVLGFYGMFLFGAAYGIFKIRSGIFSVQNGIFKAYKGIVGTVEYDEEDGRYYGCLLHIYDTVTYHADNISDLYEQYKMAVDYYLQFNSEN